MKKILYDDSNVSVTIKYTDLLKIMKEFVSNTHKTNSEIKSRKDGQIWLNTKDTSKLFGCHVSTINRWKHSGYLTYKTIGGRDYFSMDEINKIKS